MSTLVNRPWGGNVRLWSTCAGPATLLVVTALAAADAALSRACAQSTTANDPATAALLPHDLSVRGMFVSADPVVKAVMILLVLASIATWTIALAKSIEVVRARRRLTRSLAVLERAETLADALGELERSETAGVFAQAAADELRLSADVTDAAGIKERIASHLARLEAAVGRRLVRGTGMLATIGATAPFVGLFGTVWGIMDSFISISKQQTTSLAVVAPGIAEALLATGMGLVAAIPAVVIYNLCARAITAHRASATDASAAVQRLAGRDLDRELSLRFDRRSVERSLKAAE